MNLKIKTKIELMIVFSENGMSLSETNIFQHFSISFTVKRKKINLILALPEK